MSLNDLKTLGLVIFTILFLTVTYKYTHLYLYMNIQKKMSLQNVIDHFQNEIEDGYFSITFQLITLLIIIPMIGIKLNLSFTDVFILKIGAVSGTVYTLLDIIFKHHIVCKSTRVLRKNNAYQLKYIKKLKLTKDSH